MVNPTKRFYCVGNAVKGIGDILSSHVVHEEVVYVR
jgi:hypothetical protein